VPEKFSIYGEVAALVDGGVSMANNSAFHLFVDTTLENSAYHQDLGEDNLLVVSVGMGSWRQRSQPSKVFHATTFLGWNLV
jgi:uncharacterized protein